MKPKLTKEEDTQRTAGRPRSKTARAAILRAGYKLLRKAAVQSISAQQIAAEAGVSTATLYRWWPTKEAVLLDAYFSRVDTAPLLRRNGSPLQRLREHVLQVGELFTGKEGRLTARLIMAIQEDEALRQTFVDQLMRPKKELCTAVIKEAIARKELRPGTERYFFDMVFGAIFMRLLLRHEPVTKAFIGAVFDYAVELP